MYVDTLSSTLIRAFDYNEQSHELVIYFVEKYFIPFEVYTDFSMKELSKWLESDSLGKYYLNNIKNRKRMADKLIQVSIDLSKIRKEWLIQGENVRDDGSVGIYMNCTILYNEKQDKFGQNGFIVQKVPKELRDTVKNGPILGNVKEFERKVEVATPGEATGNSLSQEIADDLPF